MPLSKLASELEAEEARQERELVRDQERQRLAVSRVLVAMGWTFVGLAWGAFVLFVSISWSWWH